MTTRFVDVHDLLTEAAYWAQKSRSKSSPPGSSGSMCRQAVDHRAYRSNRVEERVREMIADRTIMVDTQGAVVGQINGLSVSSIGDYMFGQPSRITATHRLGDGEVVDIEREVEMSGPIHSKGVLILAGYLGAKYASERPLSLNARLVFEQSYGGRRWRQRLFHRALRPPLLPVGRADPATLRGHRLGEPARTWCRPSAE